MSQTINPTRMELNKTKKSLSIASHGHKLLKDKQNEMSRQFMIYAKEYIQLIDEIQAELKSAMSTVSQANAYMGINSMNEALFIPASDMSVKIGTKSIMNTQVPTVSIDVKKSSYNLPYGMAFSSDKLDTAVFRIAELMPKLVRLAQVEKTCEVLSDELERVRRRVNALEYVKIPEMSDTIKYIKQKLDENERSSIIRLMKIKDLSEQD